MTGTNKENLPTLGLIGYGVWGELILRDLANIGVSVVVCDTDPARREAALAGGAEEFYETIEALPNLDGLIIATPASDHAQTIATFDALNNQAPLFVEKPLTATTDDAKTLVERSGAPIFVMHIWTYHAGIRKLKALLESGLIGTPTLLRSTRANWTSPRTDVDCVSNLAPHDLSIFHFMLERLPKLRFAFGETLDSRFVSCVAGLQDANGPPCVLEVSNRYGEKRREFRVHGDDGVLVLPDDSTGAVTLIKGDGFILPEHQEQISYEGPPALETELRTFVAYLNGDPNALLWDVEVGADVVRTIEQIRFAAQQRVTFS